MEGLETGGNRKEALEKVIVEISENPRAARLNSAVYQLQKAGEIELSQELTVVAQISMIDLISSDMNLFRNSDTTFLFRYSRLDENIGHEVKKFNGYLKNIRGAGELDELTNNFIQKAYSLAEENDTSNPEYETKKADMISAYDRMIEEVEKVRPNYPTVEEFQAKLRDLL